MQKRSAIYAFQKTYGLEKNNHFFFKNLCLKTLWLPCLALLALQNPLVAEGICADKNSFSYFCNGACMAGHLNPLFKKPLFFWRRSGSKSEAFSKKRLLALALRAPKGALRASVHAPKVFKKTKFVFKKNLWFFLTKQSLSKKQSFFERIERTKKKRSFF
jgi:hypothetical protein